MPVGSCATIFRYGTGLETRGQSPCWASPAGQVHLLEQLALARSHAHISFGSLEYIFVMLDWF